MKSEVPFGRAPSPSPLAVARARHGQALPLPQGEEIIRGMVEDIIFLVNIFLLLRWHYGHQNLKSWRGLH